MHFVGRSTGRQGYLNLQQLLPYKLKDLKFIRFKYQVINVGELEPYLIVYDDTGFFVEVKLRMFFLEQHIGDCRRAHVLPMSMFKDSHNINITEIS